MSSPSHCAASGLDGGRRPGRITGRAHPALHALSREECLALLASHRFGRLAVVSAGVPVIRPVNYVFDHAAQAVVFRTARGSKLYALLHAGKASFEIDGIDEATRTGWSVIIQDVVAEVGVPGDIGRPVAISAEGRCFLPRAFGAALRAGAATGSRCRRRSSPRSRRSVGLPRRFDEFPSPRRSQLI